MNEISPRKLKTQTTWIALLISIVFMVLTGLLFYQLFSVITPPVTVDGHSYMPIANILRSAFSSLLLSIFIFLILRRILKKRHFR